ncbi:hypothetical protein LBW56_10935 [Ralstonia solanacearum]|uniref:hypothetical protein n=1 Tax=Ralstonia solanacearum TaxID=305 RepID=UPI001FFBD69A|nr:hypothetical protein [Ralstonia solanacearum]MDB0527205.1 hypothetical protein [Ralstonia solanacearum]
MNFIVFSNGSELLKLTLGGKHKTPVIQINDATEWLFRIVSKYSPQLLARCCNGSILTLACQQVRLASEILAP